MSGKNQFPITINWQSTNPQTGFIPNQNYQGGTKPSGTAGGAMASTNTIYSQIMDLSRMDNLGIEVNWTGTPTGTLTMLGSTSGVNWPSITFNPALTQPAGSASNYLLNMNQYPWKFMMFQYVNVSGSGTLTLYMQCKDLN